MNIVMSPAMNREVTKYGYIVADPINKYTKFLGSEPNVGLAHVNTDLTGPSNANLEAGKLELLSGLQQTRKMQLHLHTHKKPSLAAADNALEAALVAAEEALELANRGAKAFEERRKSLQPTLDTIILEGETKDEDFSAWYGTLFDNAAEKQ